MNIPDSLKVATIGPKDVLIFQNNDLSSSEPHLYICIAVMQANMFFVIAASSKEKVFRRNALRGFTADTIVSIPSRNQDASSVFDRESWIDCNTVRSYTKQEFENRFPDFKVLQKQIQDGLYQQIVNGICMSTLVEQELIDYLNQL